MSEESRALPLRRLTRGGRPAPEFGEVSPAKSLRLALAKAGQSVLSQVVDGSGVEEMRVSLEKISDTLPKGGLTMMLFGPEDGRGLISMDSSMVCAITEGLTTGRISSGDAAEREPTHTDALLCQRFVVTLLTVFAARLVGHPAADWATGFVPEDPVDDLRRLPILMDDEPYRVLTISTDFASGQRTGQMALVLPWDGRHDNPKKAKQKVQEEEKAQEWSSSMEQAVMPAEVELEAVLYRITLPLSTISSFEPGTEIPIPRRAIAEVSLEDGNDERVGIVRLGQSQGFRAIRVEQAALRKDLSPLTDLDGAPVMSGAKAPPSLADAMAQDPGLAGAAGLPSLPALDLDDEDVDMPAFDGELPALPDLPDIDGEGEEVGDLPPLELDSLPMTDLDDLPMTIE